MDKIYFYFIGRILYNNGYVNIYYPGENDFDDDGVLELYRAHEVESELNKAKISPSKAQEAVGKVLQEVREALETPEYADVVEWAKRMKESNTDYIRHLSNVIEEKDSKIRKGQEMESELREILGCADNASLTKWANHLKKRLDGADEALNDSEEYVEQLKSILQCGSDESLQGRAENLMKRLDTIRGIVERR